MALPTCVRQHIRDSLVGLALASVGLLAAPAVASAATLNVTSSGDGAAASTLRNVIAAASPGDTVVIATGIDPSLTAGEIAIDKNLTIEGQGAWQTTISANGLSRIFSIGSSNSAANVTIRDVELTQGKAPNGANGGVDDPGSAGAPGGAIRNVATVAVLSSALAGNVAGNGGTAGNTVASVGLEGGTGGSGGAIFSSGPLTIRDSTLAGNSAGDGGQGGGAMPQGGPGGTGGSGGAISTSGATVIENSTLADNAAGGGGGGGSGLGGAAGAGGDGGDGGAVSGPVVPISASTLAANAGGDGGNGGVGGGDGGDFGAISGGGTVVASILASNSFGAPGSAPGGDGAAGIAANCSPGVADGGFNLAFISPGNRGGCAASFGNGDPLLDPAGLQDNGGPTMTIAIGDASTARNQIPFGNSACLAQDQRGYARPTAANPGMCDIGAFEIKNANDLDGDLIPNAEDECPLDRVQGPDTDADGCKDFEDPDDDNDGVLDTADACPTQAATGLNGCAPPTTGGGGPTPVIPGATGPTGQRAAALKKCKRKKGATRKKCKKKAKKLPV